MILVGNQRGGAKDLAQHLLKDENDRVKVELSHDLNLNKSRSDTINRLLLGGDYGKTSFNSEIILVSKEFYLEKRRYRTAEERRDPDAPSDADVNRDRIRKTLRLTADEFRMATVLTERGATDLNTLLRTLIEEAFNRTSESKGGTGESGVRIEEGASEVSEKARSPGAQPEDRPEHGSAELLRASDGNIIAKNQPTGSEIEHARTVLARAAEAGLVETLGSQQGSRSDLRGRPSARHDSSPTTNVCAPVPKEEAAEITEFLKQRRLRRLDLVRAGYQALKILIP